MPQRTLGLASYCAIALTVLCSCAGAPAAADGMRVLIKLPPQIGTADDARWLQQLSAAAGVPVTHAAFVSSTWSAYQLRCGASVEKCQSAIARLQSSGLSESISPDGDKRAH